MLARFLRTLRAPLALRAPLRAMAGAANDAAQRLPQPVRVSGGIEELVVPANGLRVLLYEDHSSPTVTVMVTYAVGSRNEAPGYTGATHQLEHLMFKGSEQFNTEKGTSIWSTLQSLGAQMNATTWTDRTNYFEILPSDKMEVAMKVEADRMRNALLRDSDRQAEMTVVRNEYERAENDPIQKLEKDMWAAAFQAHPYHHQTLGWLSDIEKVETARLREFYDTFYTPDNAYLTLIGDFSRDNALELVATHFGPLPRGTRPPPPVITEEEAQLGPRRVEVRRPGKAGIVAVGHKVPRRLHADTPALRVLKSVMSVGKSSRFYKALTDPGLCSSVYVDHSLFHDASLFIAFARLAPGASHAEVEAILRREYEAVCRDGISADEVARAVAKIRADTAFSRDGSYSVAARLNEAIAAGDWRLYTTWLSHISAVKPEDVQRVAREYLVEDQSITGWFVPLGDDERTPVATTSPTTDDGHALAMEGGTLAPAAAAAAPPSRLPWAQRAQTLEPLPGMRLVAVPMAPADVVTIHGCLSAGDTADLAGDGSGYTLVPHMTCAMLDQGTAIHNKFELSEMLEGRGATLSFSCGPTRVHFASRCLREDVPLVVDVLAEQLRQPAFAKEELETTRKREVGKLRRVMDASMQAVASTAFNGTLYPPCHPNHQRTLEEDIQRLEAVTREQVVAFHERAYGLGSLILVATGDVDVAGLSASLKDRFGGWRSVPAATAGPLRGARVRGKRYISVPDKTSVNVLIGQPVGLDCGHEDYLALHMGVFVLGGNFSSRLMQVVRNEKGLTYGIGSGLVGFTEQGQDGSWRCAATFSPKLLDEGRRATMDLVGAWAKDGITAAELDDKIATQVGSFKVRLSTTRGVASEILSNLVRGREISYLDDFPKLVSALTLDKVNKAIQTYVDVEDLLEAGAGSVTADGCPLEAAKGGEAKATSTAEAKQA